MNLDELLEIIREDWKDFPVHKSVCQAISTYIYNNSHKLNHISFASIKVLLEEDPINDNPSSDLIILEAIQYLSGSRANVLDIKFEFYDGNDFYQLDKKDVAEAENTKEFFHPINGNNIEDFSEKIFMYFVPSKHLISTLHESA